jgi:hypothetical protein
MSGCPFIYHFYRFFWPHLILYLHFAQSAGVSVQAGGKYTTKVHFFYSITQVETDGIRLYQLCSFWNAPNIMGLRMHSVRTSESKSIKIHLYKFKGV